MKITCDNFTGGISPSDRMGIKGSYYVGENADPHRTIGYLQPGFKATHIADSADSPQVITNKIVKGVHDGINNKIYLLEASSEIQQLSDVNEALTDNDPTTFPHTIGDDLTGHSGHSGFTGSDAIIYHIGTTPYLFYSWNDTTDGDIGRVALKGTLTFEDDFLSNTCASGAVLCGTGVPKGAPHPMLEHQDTGYLCIGNGRYLVIIDGATGANGTANMTSRALPEGWVITSLFDAGVYVGITAVYLPIDTAAQTFTYQGTRSAVFFWEPSQTSGWNQKVAVPDPKIYTSFNLNGEYYIFTISRTDKGLIRKWDGSRFALEAKIKDNVNSKECPQVIGGVDEYKNGMIFTGDTYGKVYYYGSPEPGLPKVLTQIIEAEGSTAGNKTAYGIFVNPTTGRIILSSLDDTTYNLTKYGTGHDTGFVYKSRYFEFDRKMKLNYVKVYFQTLASGADDDIKITTDYGDTTTTIGSITYSGDGAVEYKKFTENVNNIQCHNFRVEIDTDEANSLTGILYSKIIVDYDPVEGDV